MKAEKYAQNMAQWGAIPQLLPVVVSFLLILDLISGLMTGTGHNIKAHY